MTAAQCNACRFWKLEDETKDPNDPNWGFGFCRRKPPVLVDCLIAAEIVPPRYGDQTDLDRLTPLGAYGASVYPATFATDWCGKYVEAS